MRVTTPHTLASVSAAPGRSEQLTYSLSGAPHRILWHKFAGKCREQLSTSAQLQRSPTV